MKVVGSFNKVSDKLKKELIPDVKPNENIWFQLLGGEYEPALGRVGFGASRSIRLVDRIYDPYQRESKNEKGEVIVNKNGEVQYEGGYVDIGVPDLIKEGRVEKYKKYWVNSIAIGIPGNGEFQLISGSVDDMEVMEFLCLSNGNKTNPHRDTTKEALYEMVNVKAQQQLERAKERKELENKLRRFARQDPDGAAEMSKILAPKGKADTTP